MSWCRWHAGFPTQWIEVAEHQKAAYIAIYNCTEDIREAVTQGAVVRKDPYFERINDFASDSTTWRICGRVDWPKDIKQVKLKGLIFKRRDPDVPTS